MELDDYQGSGWSISMRGAETGSESRSPDGKPEVRRSWREPRREKRDSWQATQTDHSARTGEGDVIASCEYSLRPDRKQGTCTTIDSPQLMATPEDISAMNSIRER
jgi:hypothetical protein